MGFLSFFGKLLGFGRRFNGTPEQYLAMVEYMAKKNNAEYSQEELLQWDEVMQKVMKVNLQPYRDFKDLVENGKADYSLVEKVDDNLKEIERRRELNKAIYGPDADLGKDDILQSNDPCAEFARKFVKDLSQHVQFTDDEKRKIDNF